MTDREIARFWGYVEKRGPEECWPWLKGTSQKGYGIFSIWCFGRYTGIDKWEVRPRRAHQIAFFLTHNRWPEPLCLHTCDNPPCCNPAHLWEGTHQENQADKVAKGRQSRGSTHSGGPKKGHYNRFYNQDKG